MWGALLRALRAGVPFRNRSNAGAVLVFFWGPLGSIQILCLAAYGMLEGAYGMLGIESR